MHQVRDGAQAQDTLESLRDELEELREKKHLFEKLEAEVGYRFCSISIFFHTELLLPNVTIWCHIDMMTSLSLPYSMVSLRGECCWGRG